MPDYRSAIEHMRERVRACDEMITPRTSRDKCEKMRRRIAELRLAIESMEKQIPKEIKLNTTFYPMVFLICPVCRYGGGTESGFEDSKYCQNCGQRLKPEGEE